MQHSLPKCPLPLSVLVRILSYVTNDTQQRQKHFGHIDAFYEQDKSRIHPSSVPACPMQGHKGL